MQSKKNTSLSSEKGPARLRGSEIECHGLYGRGKKWGNPLLVYKNDTEARPGYNTRTRHEYREEKSVLLAKVKLLAKLINKSRRITAYTGAGISTASGINDYASGKDSKALNRPQLKSPFDAQPTLSHRVLGAMHRQGMLHHWIQQNHDGLPQKAGHPQEAINEIHGAWYDPSNPVVAMEGSLRGDLFDWLQEEIQKADLCLTLGTSLCGMSADAIAEKTARRALKGRALGTVIVALQQTALDSIASLRIFATIDEVMALLATELDLDYPKTNEDLKKRLKRETHWGRQCARCGIMPIMGPCVSSAKGHTKAAVYSCEKCASTCFRKDEKTRRLDSKGATSMQNIYSVPYKPNGDRDITLKPAQRLTLDLRAKSKIVMTDGPFAGDKGQILGRTREGHYRKTTHHGPNTWQMDGRIGTSGRSSETAACKHNSRH
ncbi:hypothetical protein AAMO2058_001503100 [Amorphochlora amoebiformis]